MRKVEKGHNDLFKMIEFGLSNDMRRKKIIEYNPKIYAA